MQQMKQLHREYASVVGRSEEVQKKKPLDLWNKDM